jgi:hypothetical protein
MKKCPPGVICVENITLFLLLIILLVLGFFIYMNSSSKKITVNDTDHITIKNKSEPSISTSGLGWFPSWPYNNLPTLGSFFGPKDVLLNPYAAPYRDERYFVPEVRLDMPPGSIPINVSTNIGAVPTGTSYRQMGIITPLNGTSKDNILPLMGRPLFTNRDKWQYYTISNQHNNVKLPISFKGRSALNDYGVDQIFDGDTIYVEGYNEPFRVTVYENDTIKYLPFL